MDPTTPQESARAVGRTGRVAIVGRPNVGKSTLLNALLGQKLVIATDRPGTTRAAVLGVYLATDPPTRIAFVDTPGMHRPKSALGKVLVHEARAGLEGTDAVLVLVEAPRPKGPVVLSDADDDVLGMAKEAGVPVVVAINKIDRLAARSRLLPMIALLQEKVSPAAVVPISAVRGDQLESLVTALREVLPEGPIDAEEALTDRSERFFIAELVREAAMRNTYEEVPYGISVLVERFEDGPKVTRISTVLVVEKESHKAIVIGKKGERLKTIGTEARLEIERLLDRKVHLELWVKVVAGWTTDPVEVRRLTGDES